MRKFLVIAYGESMTTKLKFIRLKIEDELIQPVNNLAGIRDELKADIASEIIEWYLNQRKAGHVHIRYFSSPKGSDYQDLVSSGYDQTSKTAGLRRSTTVKSTDLYGSGSLL